MSCEWGQIDLGMYLIKLLDQPFQLFALERFTICFISHWSKRLHGARKFPVTVDFNSEHLYRASLILTTINYDPARCVYFPPPSTCIFSYIKYFLGEIKIFFWSMFGFSSKRFLDNLREKKSNLRFDLDFFGENRYHSRKVLYMSAQRNVTPCNRKV